MCLCAYIYGIDRLYELEYQIMNSVQWKAQNIENEIEKKIRTIATKIEENHEENAERGTTMMNEKVAAIEIEIDTGVIMTEEGEITGKTGDIEEMTDQIQTGIRYFFSTCHLDVYNSTHVCRMEKAIFNAQYTILCYKIPGLS